MRQFLGLINFQRKFIQNCSVLSKSLSECTSGPKRKKIEWSHVMEDSFNKLKEEVAKDVTLTYPDYRETAKKMELYVDASNTGAGACLMQEKETGYKAIAYASMSFSDAQKRYSTTDRELAAIRWGIQIFKCFLWGVSFTVVTDHKPLVYLNNMANTNSRLMRTIEELAEYNFDIKYKPGVDNTAADYLSRLNSNENQTKTDHVDPKCLPKNVKRICTVEGGGDSMFESILISLREANESEEYNGDVPETVQELRELLVDEIMKNMKDYNLTDNKVMRQKLKVIKYAGQQPITEILLAASKVFQIQINVFHGMKFPIIFVHDKVNCKTTIALQCISMIHYNPLDDRRKVIEPVEDKFKNTHKSNVSEPTVNVNNVLLHLSSLIDENEYTPDCEHLIYHTSVKIANAGDQKYCTLLDTGAQVSLINLQTYNDIKQLNNGHFEMKSSSNRLIGMNNQVENTLGHVELSIIINEQSCNKVPFAIVNDDSIPCCVLLGANFIIRNDIEMDFCNNTVALENINTIDKYQINSVFNDNFGPNKSDILGYLGVLTVEDSDTNEEVEEEIIPKYLISSDELKLMQDRNFALKQLKNKIRNNIPTRLWNCNPIQQFKHAAKSLQIRDGLLIKGEKANAPIVVSFSFLVEIVHKTHEKLNHIGRNKLVSIIQEYFWHPGLHKVCGDICRSCNHCQLYKTHKLDKAPPVVKINTSHPFEMVSADCLSFSKSRKGNVAALVFIDHFSKWLSVHPMRDKRSSTIANILKQRILPCIPKIPEKLLSDNGPEFIGSEFESVLSHYNIKHVFSSPYHPEGNGACERVNRTIIERLKSMANDRDWDENIYEIVINYNNTTHSKTNMSPCQCIMSKAYDEKIRFPLGKDDLECWKTGHPNFCSFIVGEKVAKLIHRTGNQLKYKLAKKYDGPYVVTKVRSNGVSYEVTDEEDRKFKVNHKFLRKWYDIPGKYSRYMLDSSLNNNNPEKVKEITDNRGIGNWVSSSDTDSSSSSDDDIDSYNLCNFRADDVMDPKLTTNLALGTKKNKGEYIGVSTVLGNKTKVSIYDGEIAINNKDLPGNVNLINKGKTSLRINAEHRLQIPFKKGEYKESEKCPQLVNNNIINLIDQTLTVSHELIDRVSEIVSGDSAPETNVNELNTLKHPIVKTIRAASHSTPVHEHRCQNDNSGVNETLMDLSSLLYISDDGTDDKDHSNPLNNSKSDEENSRGDDFSGFNAILQTEKNNLCEIKELRENIASLSSMINYSKSIIEQSKMSMSKSMVWSRYESRASNIVDETKMQPLLEEVSDVIGELPVIEERPTRVLRSHTAAMRKRAAEENYNMSSK